MNQKSIRSLVAVIVIVGHIIVLCVGLFILGILMEPFNSNTLQIILMSSPVLASTAINGAKYILANEIDIPNQQRTTLTFSFLVIFFPIALLLIILLLFYFAYYRINNFSIDSLKITLGIVETSFAGFLALISEKLFGGKVAKRG